MKSNLFLLIREIFKIQNEHSFMEQMVKDTNQKAVEGLFPDFS